MPTNDFFLLVSSLFPSLLPTNICGAPTMGQGLTFLGCGHPIVNKMDKKSLPLPPYILGGRGHMI